MFESIAKSFENLTTMGWVSQICGLVGLVVIGISYLFKKKKFLALATLSFVFFILEQAFAGLYANLIVTSICFIRNLLMFILLVTKEKALPKWIIFILLGIMWGAEFIYMGISNTFGIWDNYLPASLVTMSTFTQNSKNEYVVKIGATIHESGFLVYYLVYALPFSILRQAILVIAAIVGIIILLVKNQKTNKMKQKEA